MLNFQSQSSMSPGFLFSGKTVSIFCEPNEASQSSMSPGFLFSPKRGLAPY